MNNSKCVLTQISTQRGNRLCWDLAMAGNILHPHNSRCACSLTGLFFAGWSGYMTFCGVQEPHTAYRPSCRTGLVSKIGESMEWSGCHLDQAMSTCILK